MLLRIFLLLKLFRHYSLWTSEKSTAICDTFSAEANVFYALRALLLEKPIQLIVPIFLISTLVFSLGVQIYEKNYENVNPQEDFSHIWNSMWLVLLTMTTVGYGDFYPRTHVGRFICVLAANWGIFIVSLMILAFTNSSLFTPSQGRSYNFMKKIELKHAGNRYAAMYLNSVIQLFVMNKRKKNRQRDLENKKITLLIRAKIFFRKFKFFRLLSLQIEKTPEEMLRIINEKLAYEIDRLEEVIRDAKEMDEQIETFLELQEKSIEYLNESKAFIKNCC